MRQVFLLVILFGLTTGHLPQGPAEQQSEISPVRAQNGMVVSAVREASEAGVLILGQGGNAIDASVATGFALAVVYPAAGNVGGGGFMVLRLADGTTTTIDYRETAPSAASRDMYLDDDGEVDTGLSREGYLASGVPGSVAGLLLAHERYGQLPLEAVMEPAIRLAEDGFVLSRRQAAQFNSHRRRFSRYPSTMKYFSREDGAIRFREGDLFLQKDLAGVLRRIRDKGHDGFYRGTTADLIVREMERGGGIITHEDLAAYRAIERPPVTGFYRDYRIISMRPPSSGGIALVQLLNAMESHPIGEMGYHSSETVHLMGEAMRRVYADRAEWLGDSDFVPVPIYELTDKSYMEHRMADFETHRATPSDSVTHGEPFALESAETTHYSIVDAAGNAVSTTTTINGVFGSGVVIDGTGFFMNNEMDDFAAAPGVPNMFGLVGGDANAIQPGKRMLSSMTPTIIEDPGGELFMVVGTPGGSHIITIVMQVIMNVIDHGMDIGTAVSMPRIHHQWLPDRLYHERFALATDVLRNLEARGWRTERIGNRGRADAVLVGYEEQLDEPGSLERWYYGGADPRGEDVAIGY